MTSELLKRIACVIERTPEWNSYLGAEEILRLILEGHAIVPKEPTDEMLIDSGTVNGYEGVMPDADHIAWWKAMLAAAPDPLS
jgi:hypothetical protein